MTVTSKFGKLTVAGALFAAMTTPSLAEWVVVQAGDECMLMEESAVKDEIRIAGPFATEAEAESAKGNYSQCQIEKN